MKAISNPFHNTDIPVKHSSNLKPSFAAMASTILELTVEATIASLSERVIEHIKTKEPFVRAYQWACR